MKRLSLAILVILVIFKNLTILLDLVIFVMLLNLVILKKYENFC